MSYPKSLERGCVQGSLYSMNGRIMGEGVLLEGAPLIVKARKIGTLVITRMGQKEGGSPSLPK